MPHETSFMEEFRVLEYIIRHSTSVSMTEYLHKEVQTETGI